MKQHIRIRRPESHQDEQRLVYITRHRCPQGESLAAAGQEDPDLLLFPIGIHGAGMPTGAAFSVPAYEPCPACGQKPAVWAQWYTRTVIDLGGTRR